MQTDGRIGTNARLDRTPGTFRVAESPFKSAGSLITALITKTGKMWHYRSEWIGGLGFTPCAVDEGNWQKALWQDATGRWWIQNTIRPGVWLPDIDATLALVNRPELGDDVAPMNAEHIRHGEA